MHTLRAVAIENGLVVATDADGTEFHVEIDEQIRARLRDSAPQTGSIRKLSPREIQTQIRSGMSAEEVAEITGAPLEYIQRYEGPVLAEREYVVESALGVPVRALADSDPEAPTPTFGGVIGDRLAQLSARGAEWVSWKEATGGWILKLGFSSETIEHDARWRFDPKKLTLSPLNAEAVALSQQGEIGASLLPRLRAVPADAANPDTARFDSAVFQTPFQVEPSEPEAPPTRERSGAHSATADTAPHHEPIAYGRGRVIEPRTGAISVIPEKSGAELGETGDLLETLRRRRGEREAAVHEEAEAEAESTTRSPHTASIRVLERPMTIERDDRTDRPKPMAVERPANNSETVPVRPARRGRTSMPSWDEIVFGARPDDEA